MKSNFKKIIISILSIIIIVFCFFGYKYYSENYVTHAAYALVPSEIPEKVKATDKEGEIIQGIYSYKYKLTFVEESGKSFEKEAFIEGTNPVPLTPNSYVKSKISEKRVGVPTEIQKSLIPDNVLKILKG